MASVELFAAAGWLHTHTHTRTHTHVHSPLSPLRCKAARGHPALILPNAEHPVLPLQILTQAAQALTVGSNGLPTSPLNVPWESWSTACASGNHLHIISIHPHAKDTQSVTPACSSRVSQVYMTHKMHLIMSAGRSSTGKCICPRGLWGSVQMEQLLGGDHSIPQSVLSLSHHRAGSPTWPAERVGEKRKSL